MTVEQAKQLLNVGLAREAKNEDGLAVVDQAMVTWLNDLELRVVKLEGGQMAGEIFLPQTKLTVEEIQLRKKHLEAAMGNLIREFESVAPGLEVDAIVIDRQGTRSNATFNLQLPPGVKSIVWKVRASVLI